MVPIKPCVIVFCTLLGLFLNPVGSAFAEDSKQWQTYDGYQPEGYGRHIVFVSGDEEYRSEEALPMLAKIMAVRHGFKCTVLFAQDPEKLGIVDPKAENFPGLEALRTADLVLFGANLEKWPEEIRSRTIPYLRSGRPYVRLHTGERGSAHEDPLNKSYQLRDGRKGRVSYIQMEDGTKSEEEIRREIVSEIFWCLGMSVPANTDVTPVDATRPPEDHLRKISDFDLKAPLYEPGGEPHGEPSAPYLDVTKGREGHGYDFADHPVNRHRVYNFHRRQAAHFLKAENEVPSLLSYAPELDGTVFGHWGKFHKNGYKDRRWNIMDVGNVMCGVFRAPGSGAQARTIAIRLNDDYSCAFDTETLSFTHLWKGGFVEFQPNRWGIGNGISPAGEVVEKKLTPEQEGEFLGYSRIGEKVALHYRVEGKSYSVRPDISEDGKLMTDPKPVELVDMALSGKALYAEQSITLSGTVGERVPGTPFAFDRIPVPHYNPFGSLMFFGGHDFFSNGDAAVCTMMGDVWRVTGLDKTLQNVTWTRIATGLSQALGLAVFEDKIYVTCRDRIVRLHDLNKDGEIDLYENFCDAFEVSTGGHDFSVSLQRDENGYFYFVSAKEGVVRISPDGKTVESMATGLRNSNGLGVNPNGTEVVVSTNQGDWTPASAVFEVRQGDFYGRRATKDGDPIAPAMCYIPRTYCNSTGAQRFVDSETWGALNGQLLTFSFGAGTWQMILRNPSDDPDRRTQGALVPLPGDFESGAHRGAFHPVDGQLYVTGADGWGNYAITDGSFARVRYLGDKHSNLPVGWKAHRNGMVVTLTNPVDPSSVKKENFFAQTWNYEYSDAYGSLEYSLKQPELPGHDPLSIQSAHLLEDGKSVFLEIPDLQPAMQVQLYGELKNKAGEDFVVDLYPTVLWLEDDFSDFKGYRKSDPDKPTDLTLRVRWSSPFQPKVPQGKPGRKITVAMVSGLQFEPKEFTVKPGEQITVYLDNQDSIPHNWLLAKPGTYQTVGAASSAMLTDPDAAAKHYAPETDDVLHYSPMLYHRNRYSLHITAPEEPGRYPFMCTFPGHWAVMKGEMVVEADAER